MSSTTTITSLRQHNTNVSTKYAGQTERLSFRHRGSQEERDGDPATTAVGVQPVISQHETLQTIDGHCLSSIPVQDAQNLNPLRDEALKGTKQKYPLNLSINNEKKNSHRADTQCTSLGASPNPPDLTISGLHVASSPASTHLLFPPLPIYGPPSSLQIIQFQITRVISFCLSLSFLAFIVICSCLSKITALLRHAMLRLTFKYPDAGRIFHREEQDRHRARKKAEKIWRRGQCARRGKKDEEDLDRHGGTDDAENGREELEYPPLEGGPDSLICDIGYYARRVGLDVEAFKVQTEDGFLIDLWHVYNPQEYNPLLNDDRGPHQPGILYHQKPSHMPTSGCRYPILLMPGLLQSAGAYCSNDDDSLAFYLCKVGYDVWLGDNRCGFHPEHVTLLYSDPRMWAWNIRHMGVLDLPALVSRILYETGFEKLGLVCHSQGTAETLVALSKGQRPDLGERISVFCALAPVAYAGPLIKKTYFRFITNISPSTFSIFFGIHSFIPFMMTVHSILPGRVYGSLGYLVFSYLFGWSDARWDRGLRNRFFQFSPVYVSAESMRWWLGRDGFATHECILATKEEGILEEQEDQLYEDGRHDGMGRGDNAWYGPGTPPFALWVAGSDHLVDGRRLIRRLQNGREPHAHLVYSKVIEEYEHLDVLWAMDAIEQVGSEVRDVIYQTMSEQDKAVCRTPKGVIAHPS